MTEILCSHRRARTHEIRWLVVHVNVGPEQQKQAVAVARYNARPDIIGGYHEIIDNVEMVTTAHDNEEVNGAGTNGNRYGLHYCLIGYADQLPLQWQDGYSQAELGILSGRLKAKCAEHGIPALLLSPTDLRNGRKGICGHVTLRDAFPADTTHYDPGPGFPWSQLVAAVRGGDVAPAPIEEDDMPRFITTQGTGDETWWLFDGYTRRPLHAGENQILFDLGLVKSASDVKVVANEYLSTIPIEPAYVK